MVIGGLGVTLLPESAVDAELLRGRPEVVVRTFAAPAPDREIGLLWRKTSPRGDEFALLGALLGRVQSGTHASAFSERP